MLSRKVLLHRMNSDQNEDLIEYESRITQLKKTTSLTKRKLEKEYNEEKEVAFVYRQCVSFSK